MKNILLRSKNILTKVQTENNVYLLILVHLHAPGFESAGFGWKKYHKDSEPDPALNTPYSAPLKYLAGSG
jgi:hypothetical protein